MAFPTAAIDEAISRTSATGTLEADLKTHANTFHTGLTAVIVTAAGKTATDPEFVAIEEAVLDVIRVCAEAMADS